MVAKSRSASSNKWGQIKASTTGGVVELPALISWAFFFTGSFLVSIPVLIYNQLIEGYWFGPQTFCSESFPSVYHERAFILYNFLAVYLLPLLTILVCYSAMLYQMGHPTVAPADNHAQVL